MCIIYTVRYLCGHLVHLDDPPVTPCSEAGPEPTVQPQKPTTKPVKPSKKIPPQRKNQKQAISTPPSTPPTRYCPIPLLPTIIHSEQVCRVCSAGLLAFARRVYYFEVGCMMLKMAPRLAQERELYYKDLEDGKDRSFEYYEKNIIDRILPPALLLKCWVAWRLDRQRFRTLGVCGGVDGELGKGFRWFEDDGRLRMRFPTMYFFDDFLGGLILTTNLRIHAETEAERNLQKKLRLLDTVVEARCLEAYALEQDHDGFGLAELVPILKRANDLRHCCEVSVGSGDEDDVVGDEGDGEADEGEIEEGSEEGEIKEGREEVMKKRGEKEMGTEEVKEGSEEFEEGSEEGEIKERSGEDQVKGDMVKRP